MFLKKTKQKNPEKFDIILGVPDAKDGLFVVMSHMWCDFNIHV